MRMCMQCLWMHGSFSCGTTAKAALTVPVVSRRVPRFCDICYSTYAWLITADGKSLEEKKSAVTEHIERLKGCPLAKAGASGVLLAPPGIFVGFFGSCVPLQPTGGLFRGPNLMRPDGAQ